MVYNLFDPHQKFSFNEIIYINMYDKKIFQEKSIVLIIKKYKKLPLFFNDIFFEEKIVIYKYI